MKRFQSVYKKKMALGGNGQPPVEPRIKFNRQAIIDSVDMNDVWKNDIFTTTGAQDAVKTGIKRYIDFGGTPGAKTSTGTASAAVGAARPDAVAPTGSSTMSKIATVAKGMQPYMSNIANAFRKPPLPKTPGLVSPVTLPKIDMSNSRNEVARRVRTADLSAERNLDSNTAAAVKNAYLATGIQGINSVNAQEAQMNASQSGRAAEMNLNVDRVNVGAMNEYQDSVVNRKIAMQREQSGNMANAADKSIAIANEKAKGELDLKKFSVLREIWKQSGIDTRLMKRLEEQGILKPGELAPQRFGGQLRKVFADGGLLEDPKPAYNFAGTKVPTKADSTQYAADFNSMYQLDPTALAAQAKEQKYGVVLPYPAGDKRNDELYWMQRNKYNAYGDARSHMSVLNSATLKGGAAAGAKKLSSFKKVY